MKRSDNKPLGCGICPYKTNSACHLERHLRIHTGQKPYACNMCSYKATDGGLLKRHMRIHSGEKPFTCQICGHKTAQSCSLKDHMAVHTGKKRYACDICPFQCSRIGRLRDHQLQHKDVRVKKEVSSKQPDLPHRDTDTELKPSSCKCPQCGLEFPGMPNLNRHIATAHLKASSESLDPTSHDETTADLPYHCSLCSASADTLDTLNTHFTRHILYRCLECDATFESSTELVAHRSDHSEELIFNCNKCDFKSKTRNELRGHERIHNSIQSLICTECDFVSKSNAEFSQHLQTHTSTEMVQCNICSTKFGKTTELKEHMAIHYSRSRARMTRKPTTIAPELSNVGTFHCYYCSYKSSEENQMTKHIQGVHITPSVSSEQNNEDRNKQNESDSPKIKEPDGASHIDEAKALVPNSIHLIPPRMAQIKSCTKSNSGYTLQTPKISECNHCPCNLYRFPWLRNLECHYQPLTHFMNPNDTDFTAGLLPFHCGKCGACFTHDSHQHTELSTDKQEIAKCPLTSREHTNNYAYHGHETGAEMYNPQKDCTASGSIQISATDGSPVDNVGALNGSPNSSLKRSRDVSHQSNSTNSDLDQMFTETEPNLQKVKKEYYELSTVQETKNYDNEDESGNLKYGNLKSEEDRSKSAEILLSKLRQFFSDSFPKIACPSEGDSDQSTLTANSSTHDILTIELSSDSNASDHSD